MDIGMRTAGPYTLKLPGHNTPGHNPSPGWRCSVVVSGVRRMNEVNRCRARLVPGWVTVFGLVYHLDVTSRLGQLSLASLRGRLIEYQLRLG